MLLLQPMETLRLRCCPITNASSVARNQRNAALQAWKLMPLQIIYPAETDRLTSLWHQSKFRILGSYRRVHVEYSTLSEKSFTRTRDIAPILPFHDTCDSTATSRSPGQGWLAKYQAAFHERRVFVIRGA